MISTVNDTAASRSYSRGGTAEHNAAHRRRMIDRVDSTPVTSSSSVTLQQQQQQRLAGGGKPSESELSRQESDLRSCAFFWSQIHELDRRATVEMESTPTGNNRAQQDIHFDEDDDDVFSSSDVTGILAAAPPKSKNINSSSIDGDRFMVQNRRPSGDTCGESISLNYIKYPETSKPVEFAAQRLNRSKSMPSSGARNAGAGGRRKSDILYFSYTESQQSGVDI